MADGATSANASDEAAGELRAAIIRLAGKGHTAAQIRTWAMEFGAVVSDPPMQPDTIEAVLVDQLLRLTPAQSVPTAPVVPDDELPPPDVADARGALDVDREAEFEQRADGAPTAVTSRRVIWANLHGEPPARDWIVRDWFGYFPTLISGRGSAGKSLLMQQTASAIAVGKSFLGHVEDAKRVLYWACEEDEEELWRRQLRFARWLKTDLAAFDETFYADARLGLENTLYSTEYGRPMWTPTVEILRQQVNDFAADMMVIDNIGQVYGADENKRHDVTAFLNGLIGLVTDRKFCIVLIGHPAKVNGSEFAGSGAWENAARMRLYLGDRLPDEKEPESDEDVDPRIRVLAKRKTNYSERDYLRFTLDEGVFNVEQLDGGSSGVVDMLRKRKAHRVVIDGLKELQQRGLVASESPGKNYLPALLKQYKFHDQLSPGELTQAMRKLIHDGVIARGVVGRDNARRPRHGLVITAEADVHPADGGVADAGELQA